MIAYNANITKDKTKALSFSEKALMVDSSDQELKNNRDLISKLNLVPSNKTMMVSTNAKGETAIIGSDGAVSTIGKDGSINIATKEGKVVTIISGVTTIIENGRITTIGRDGKVSSLSPPPTPSTPPKKTGSGTPKTPKAPKKK